MSIDLGELINHCRTSGLRRTKALEVLLATLLKADRPMTLARLQKSRALSSQCDKATIYRLLHRLADAGIVRRLGLHERAAYFALAPAQSAHSPRSAISHAPGPSGFPDRAILRVSLG